MKIGVLKEIKTHEYRVGLLPASVYELTQKGHQVYVEANAGAGIGYSDQDYQAVGAHVLYTSDEVLEEATLIVKVKEPQPSEWVKLKPHHILFTFLHLAPDREQTLGLLASGCAAIAYETVTDAHRGLPLLAPMSAVAGRMSIQIGASLLQKENGGTGILLGGISGVHPGKVLIIGGGVVGINAARIALGMGASVVVMDKNVKRLEELDFLFQGHLKTIYSTASALEHHMQGSDLVVGGVLVVGDKAPKIVTRKMIATMKPGSVFVDVAIDQGGCSETSRPTTHSHPTYLEEGVIHYCVTNIPGAVARTSTQALNNVTLPFALELAGKGLEKALQENVHLRNGLNVYQGRLTHPMVAQALGMPYGE